MVCSAVNCLLLGDQVNVFVLLEAGGAVRGPIGAAAKGRRRAGRVRGHYLILPRHYRHPAQGQRRSDREHMYYVEWLMLHRTSDTTVPISPLPNYSYGTSPTR